MFTVSRGAAILVFSSANSLTALLLVSARYAELNVTHCNE